MLGICLTSIYSLSEEDGGADSATLLTDNDFSYVRERFGVATGEDLQLSSPFAYE